MGYCMEQRDTNFKIKKENVAEAFKACQTLFGKETIEDSGGRHFSWVDTKVLMEATNLKEFMEEWRWEIVLDEDGNVTDIGFEGDKIGDDEYLFNTIAPFVESGSFIEMSGEDGCLWRWVFKDGKLHDISPEINWGE